MGIRVEAPDRRSLCACLSQMLVVLATECARNLLRMYHYSSLPACQSLRPHHRAPEDQAKYPIVYFTGQRGRLRQFPVTLR